MTRNNYIWHGNCELAYKLIVFNKIEKEILVIARTGAMSNG